MSVGTRRSEGSRQVKGEKRDRRRILAIAIVCCILIGIVFAVKSCEDTRTFSSERVAAAARVKMPKWVEKDILPLESNSRRGEYLEELTAIAIHYVGNPGSTARANRNFYGKDDTTVNSHFLVGLEGEVIWCLPLEEKSSATSDRNRDTISIEVCHPDEGGEFSPASYQALVELTAWLCVELDLSAKDVIRHYDATGKACPLYYVDNEEAWEQLKQDVAAEMKALS